MVQYIKLNDRSSSDTNNITVQVGYIHGTKQDRQPVDTTLTWCNSKAFREKVSFTLNDVIRRIPGPCPSLYEIRP